MDSFSSMKNKLSAIGIYNIENGSNIYNELKAYSVELDRIFSELDTMLREYFIETAQNYGITLREKFLGREKTEYPLEKRREMLKIQQQMMGGECTPKSFEKFLKGCGLTNVQVSESFARQRIAVNISDELSSAAKKEIEEKVNAEVPAQILVTFNYSE